MEPRSKIDSFELSQAIHRIQTQLRWKPGSAEWHLKQRIRRGHLPVTATLSEYEALIQTVVHGPTALVYIFWHKDDPYISIVDDIDDKHWLVMFALSGVLESAYIVERPHLYLNKSDFEYVDLLAKVMSHDDE